MDSTANDPGFLAREREYFARRTDGCDKKPLGELDPLGVYDDYEEAYDVYGKQSLLAYLFKDYGDGTGFELGAYGVESFYRNWKVLARDRDAFEFVARLLMEG